MNELKLTKKQEKFCVEYVKTGNASEAYRRSYNISNMKSKTVNERASVLLAENKITTRVNQLKAVEAEKAGIEIKDITDQLIEIKAICMQEKKVKDKNGKEIYAQFNPNSAIKALENLAKHMGYYEKDNKQKAQSISVGFERD